MAQLCAEIDDEESAIELIMPIFAELPRQSRHELSSDIASWLWVDLIGKEYMPTDDGKYRWALKTHLDLALKAKTPEGVLGNLRSLTRWLECLGARATTQWLLQLIKIEAPGTWYVDEEDRVQCVRSSVDLSPRMRSYLNSFDKRLKAKAEVKLKEVLRSARALENAQLLLDDDLSM